MFLGIEIGGTKLQLGASRGDGLEFTDFRRLDVQPERGAPGIRDQIAAVGRELVAQYDVRSVGIGFGGPVDARNGTTIKSHQINGWDNFPLGPWCCEALGVRTLLGNDCDLATLAESRWGAGAGRNSVFYITVGTGVGGGCVISGQLLGQSRPAIAEIGHLRPGLHAVDPSATVESLASGWGIAAAARSACRADPAHPDAESLLRICGEDLDQLTTVMIAQSARSGNVIARQSIDQSCRALGWAIAQVVTLLAPETIVIGGGVSLIGEDLFFAPVRRYAQQYVFRPLIDSFQIVPAQLGEKIVVYGAIALASTAKSV
jgi:glucokinase